MTTPLKLEQAREIFLRELGKLAPQVHETLYRDAFPVYAAVLRNRRATIRVGRKGLKLLSFQGLPRDKGATPKLNDYDELRKTGNWVTGYVNKRGEFTLKGFGALQVWQEATAKQEPKSLDPLPCDPLTEKELDTIKQALTAWGNTFGIRDSWLYEAALLALDLAHTTGVKGLVSQGLQRPSYLQKLTDAPIFVVQLDLNGTFPSPAEVQKQYRKFYQENHGKLIAMFKRNVRWLIQDHFLELTHDEIAKNYGEDKSYSGDDVRKGVKAAANNISFTLHDVNRRIKKRAKRG